MPVFPGCQPLLNLIMTNNALSGVKGAGFEPAYSFSAILPFTAHYIFTDRAVIYPRLRYYCSNLMSSGNVL